MKILVFQHHFAPYRDGYYKLLDNDARFELVFYVFEKGFATHNEWNYESKFKNVYYLEDNKNIGLIKYKKGMFSALMKENCDVCITPYWTLPFFKPFLKKKPRFIFSADTCQDTKKFPGSRILRKIIYNRFDAIFCPGNKSKDYFVSYGINENRIYLGSYTNDAQLIMKRYSNFEAESQLIKKSLSISEDEFVFLFVGKLIKSRRIIDLLSVASALDGQKVKFLVIGNGPDTFLVEEYCKNHENLIHIPEVEISQLEQYYCISNCYLHPGAEPYSLALYEAAIVGMPIISTHNVGAVNDIVYEGKNGLLYTEGNQQSLLNSVLLMISEYNRFKFESLQIKEYISENRGVNWAASNLIEAIQLN